MPPPSPIHEWGAEPDETAQSVSRAVSPPLERRQIRSPRPPLHARRPKSQQGNVCSQRARPMPVLSFPTIERVLKPARRDRRSASASTSPASALPRAPPRPREPRGTSPPCPRVGPHHPRSWPMHTCLAPKVSPWGRQQGSQRKYEGAGRIAWRTRGEGEGGRARRQRCVRPHLPGCARKLVARGD